jgi:cardiolipin synthase
LKPSDSSINIPNILTLIRILLAPLFVIMVLKEMPVHAFLVFAVAAISDGLDGFIARYFNQRTVLGSYLDPIADKLLLTSAYVSLAVLKFIPAWLAVIVISRDVIITLGFMVLQIFSYRFKLNPSFISKCNTFLQLSTILVVLLNPVIGTESIPIKFLFWATAVFTILSGFHYIYIGMNILQTATGENNKSLK